MGKYFYMSIYTSVYVQNMYTYMYLSYFYMSLTIEFSF